LDAKSIEFYIKDENISNYFEKVVSELKSWQEDRGSENSCFNATKVCSNYISTDLQAILKEEKGPVDLEKRITPENFAELICMTSEGEISSNIAKMVLIEMFKTQKDPSDIIAEKGWAQITDTGEIEGIIKEVLIKNPKAVEDFKAGKENSFAFLIGQTMAASKGKANPQAVAELLKK